MTTAIAYVSANASRLCVFTPDVPENGAPSTAAGNNQSSIARNAVCHASWRPVDWLRCSTGDVTALYPLVDEDHCCSAERCSQCPLPTGHGTTVSGNTRVRVEPLHTQGPRHRRQIERHAATVRNKNQILRARLRQTVADRLRVHEVPVRHRRGKVEPRRIAACVAHVLPDQFPDRIVLVVARCSKTDRCSIVAVH